MKPSPEQLAATLNSMALEWDGRAEKGLLPFDDIGPEEVAIARRVAAGYRELAAKLLEPINLKARKAA